MRVLDTAPAAPRRRRYRFELWPAVFTLVSLALLLSLGTWQVQRLGWKRDLIAHAEERLRSAPEPLPPEPADYEALDFRRVTTAGSYRHDAAFGFGFSAVGGQPGGRVVTPLTLSDGRTLLVDRGWVPAELLPPNLPDGLEPAGEVALSGVARYRGEDVRRGFFQPDDDPAGRRWYVWDLARMAEAVGTPVLPITLMAEPSGEGVPAALPRAEPVRVDLSNNHLSYAVTWYGLALVLVGTYLAFSFRGVDAAPDRSTT